MSSSIDSSFTCPKGHCVINDENGGSIVDNTEGFGAFDDLNLQPSTRNFDNGGCSIEHNTKYLRETYQVENVVYDPVTLDEKHNSHVLNQVHEQSNFDTATSMSVLNILICPVARRQHIELSKKAIEKNVNGGIV